ncbi:hypothetical protein OQA88_7938 [Cercophora sp. LCS_1]
MLRRALLALLSLTSLVRALAAPIQEEATSPSINIRTTQTCYASETSQRVCYDPPNSTPQGISPGDVTLIALALRSYGQQTKAGQLFSMAAVDAPNCAEWSLYLFGSALVTAKHIGGATVNSSVLFTDIANTIDGGVGATDDQKAAALVGCGASGGSFGVQFDANNPAYKGAGYPAGFTPEGILIKVVSSRVQGS